MVFKNASKFDALQMDGEGRWEGTVGQGGTEETPRVRVYVIYIVSQKILQIRFCQHFVKFPPIMIIFYWKMAKRLELCEMHSFSTSSNSHHHTTVLNADVQNCYTMLKVVICSKLSHDLISTQLCSKWAPHTLTQAHRRRRHKKREAAFSASRFLWRRRICGFTVTCHSIGLKGPT